MRTKRHDCRPNWQRCLESCTTAAVMVELREQARLIRKTVELLREGKQEVPVSAMDMAVIIAEDLEARAEELGKFEIGSVDVSVRPRGSTGPYKKANEEKKKQWFDNLVRTVATGKITIGVAPSERTGEKA